MIELITTAMIITVLAATSAALIATSIQLFVYLPREMKARSAAQEALDVMIDGESGGSGSAAVLMGMRSAASINGASPLHFTFITGYPGRENQRIVEFSYDQASRVINRSHSAVGSTGIVQEVIPYYGSGDIKVYGVAATPNSIFTYYKADGSAWVSGTDNVNTIARVDISIVVKCGAGSLTEGSFQTTTGVDIKQYL